MLAIVRRVPWWVWVSAAPLGLGAWTPIVPGIELERRRWIAWGAVWSVITIVGWAIAVTAGDGPDDGVAGGGLIILGWVGAIATTLIVRHAYVRESA
jgi:hypothetical protein